MTPFVSIAVADSQDQAVIATVSAVGSLADRRDWDALRTLFADEVALDYTSLVGGKPARQTSEELIAGWKTGLGRFAATEHVIADFNVKIDGDTAECRSRFIATHVRDPAGRDRWTCGGRYVHTLKRTATGWQVTGIVMTMEWEQGTR